VIIKIFCNPFYENQIQWVLNFLIPTQHWSLCHSNIIIFTQEFYRALFQIISTYKRVGQRHSPKKRYLKCFFWESIHFHTFLWVVHYWGQYNYWNIHIYVLCINTLICTWKYFWNKNIPYAILDKIIFFIQYYSNTVHNYSHIFYLLDYWCICCVLSIFNSNQLYIRLEIFL